MRIPAAVYRIQINTSFRFDAVREIIPYLDELGISDIYASPLFTATAGCMHGYHVCDHRQMNSEIGTPQDFAAVSDELQRRGMGWVQDIVPNHMAYNRGNHLLMDVFELGEHSEFRSFFDIDWDHPAVALKGKVLAPFLAIHYMHALENGEIRLEYGEDGCAICYHTLRFPVRFDSYGVIFSPVLSDLPHSLGRDHPDFSAFSMAYSVLMSPAPGAVTEACEQREIAKGIFWGLYTQNAVIRESMDRAVGRFNGSAGDPGSFALLDALLSRQEYRLSLWSAAMKEINYRRFFSVNELVCLRVEEDRVFDHIHSLIFCLIDEGKISGLRIDHIDGLYDPTAYLHKIRDRVGDLYITLEKILGPGEEIPDEWPVQGTTGYDFLNYVNGVFCDTANEHKFDLLYTGFVASSMPYRIIVTEKKRQMIRYLMSGEIDNLARLLSTIFLHERCGRDIMYPGFRRALAEVMAHFPVYRTYIHDGTIRDEDRATLHAAIAAAKQVNQDFEYELSCLERLFLAPPGGGSAETGEDHWLSFMMRFQQFTGPLMGKGLEDTVLYVYNRLLSLNEVGGDPGLFGVTLEQFHHLNEVRAQKNPASTNATSTHDTKRGEDVRARISVLSEIPEIWERRIGLWRLMNAPFKTSVNGVISPDPNDEYFLYQTLVGALPLSREDLPSFVERMRLYLIKAVREAHVHSSWPEPGRQYEDAYLVFLERIMEPSVENPFLPDLLAFQKRIAHYGMFTSLSQVLVKITSPGLPDFYRGTELWDLNLVDPDNRRPVDFSRLGRILMELAGREQGDMRTLARELLESREDGRVKLFVTHRALKARKLHLEVFQQGDYIPLVVGGMRAHHIIAYARVYGGAYAVTVAPRFFTRLIREGEYPLGTSVWHDTWIALPPGAPRRWTDAITDQTMDAEGMLLVGDVLKDFPVALLISTP
jgi:(1->4)-alpha-D-glucan 1-alpha-D-glucosylmutase